MKRLILVFIGSLAVINSFASDEVTIKVEGCSVSMYHEVIGLLEAEDLKQGVGYSSKCKPGILPERRVERTIIKVNYKNDLSQRCSLIATRSYYCHSLPW